jgi:hypothetical protein
MDVEASDADAVATVAAKPEASRPRTRTIARVLRKREFIVDSLGL